MKRQQPRIEKFFCKRKCAPRNQLDGPEGIHGEVNDCTWYSKFENLHFLLVICLEESFANSTKIGDSNYSSGKFSFQVMMKFVEHWISLHCRWIKWERAPEPLWRCSCWIRRSVSGYEFCIWYVFIASEIWTVSSLIHSSIFSWFQWSGPSDPLWRCNSWTRRSVNGHELYTWYMFITTNSWSISNPKLKIAVKTHGEELTSPLKGSSLMHTHRLIRRHGGIKKWKIPKALLKAARNWRSWSWLPNLLMIPSLLLFNFKKMS